MGTICLTMKYEEYWCFYCKVVLQIESKSKAHLQALQQELEPFVCSSCFSGICRLVLLIQATHP